MAIGIQTMLFLNPVKKFAADKDERVILNPSRFIFDNFQNSYRIYDMLY